MNTYQEFCRLRDLHIPGVNAPKHTEADAFYMAAAQLAVPDGYKVAPLEPTPEIIAAAAVAAWPTASPADITLARLAAPIVLMQMDMAPGTTVEAVAGMLATMAPAYRAMLAAAPIPPAADQHPDDAAVDRFAAAMKEKLTLTRAKGRSGWDDPDQCSVDDLTVMLRNQANGGDPVDAGNFAMMVHQRGARIAPPKYARADAIEAAELQTVLMDTFAHCRPEHPAGITAWAKAALLEVKDSLRYPFTMSAALADVLGLPNFRTGPIADVYRAAGAEIRTNCGDEQAFVLDRYLRLALEHGDEWRTAAEADLKAAYARAEASRAVKS
ncbi:hypothetical protein [Janthinobacterium sp. SUN033]|uniref:hypothetical protein n=1 Tax=Janthinobacterium sp. SUN033 TaxID=3002439 RepID=UPI0025B1A5FB|nr:hypothetical protein [Janthinobacterium sp. SUN033]MDN2675672.1 hypothetical protein [Janthinobacterium sp. SUN033]